MITLARQSAEKKAVRDLGSLVVEDGNIEVAGRHRTYHEVTPANLAKGAPLLLVFHGSNQTGKKVRAFSGYTFDALAARHGVRVVYLNGYKAHWNDGRISVNFPARRENYDDVAFTRAVISRSVDNGGTDPSRVFVAGYSNGGQMVIRLIHEAPELFAGATIISATKPARENFMIDGELRPLPVLLIHGTRDPLVPYNGGMASLWGFRPRGLGLSFSESAEYYARCNGIDAEPVISRPQPGRQARKTSIETADYREAGKPSVKAVTVHNGGHVIPNLTAAAPRIMGRTNQEFDTGQEMWEFYAAEGKA
ncbi:alpha/beta hydrolase family esterase [Amycolatopsis pigmentata]|uniref:Alpha/beta hydrolase family esterase n=1 Tax=Amycolatopsis pigmentata TaxID=450801 RepID=A0ABW5G5D1_9PSEU